MADILTSVKGYKALKEHHKVMEDKNMREMFEQNTKRFEEFR